VLGAARAGKLWGEGRRRKSSRGKSRGTTEQRQSNENTEYQWAAKRSEKLGGKGSELGAASCSRASDSVVDE
jgi:hypothetical protein